MFTSIIAFFLLISITGCLSFGFTHRPGDNVIKADVKDDIYPIVAEGSGFLWDSCEVANAKAMSKLNEALKPGDKIANLEWYNFQGNSYSDTPNCVKETGWAWAVYTFWWPTATKVRVRAYPISEEKPKISKAVKKKPAVVKAPKAKMVKAIVPKKNIKNPLKLISYEVKRHSDDYDRNFVSLTLKLKNTGAERITAYKIVVSAKTKLGRDIAKFTFTNESASMSSFDISDDSYTWRDNPFIDGEIYDNLAGVSSENLLLEITSQTIVRDQKTIAH